MGVVREVSSAAAFLDRDGVINRAIVRDGRPYPPASLEQLEILPGVPRALAALHEAGLRLIVVSNQPDVARGTAAQESVDAINEALLRALPLDAIRCCLHDTHHDCDCRKPRPGLLLKAAADFDIDLSRSWMVGDRWRDIEAGRAAGCHTIFIDYAYKEAQPEQMDHRVASLPEAVPIILGELQCQSSKA
jgi:D-glycero-D-manno-heptose 1,7-bisphosphate phosphatase